MIEASLLRWLQRPTVERATNSVVELTALLSSDRGLKRGQNQDRALAFAVPASDAQLSGARVFILADGMGGMRDGDLCASTAVSAFAAGLLAVVDQDARAALRGAADRANAAVCSVAHGAGGSTLSAVLVEANGRAHGLNCGDSRIYAIAADRTLKRMTTDDNLAERVGGSGRELIRFVGMKDEFAVDIVDVASDQRQVILTSDGIHFIAADTFERVARHANSLRILVERVTVLARWNGAPDNATMIALEISPESDLFSPAADGEILFYDPYSSISFQLYDLPVRQPETGPEPQRDASTEEIAAGALAKESAKSPQTMMTPDEAAAPGHTHPKKSGRRGSQRPPNPVQYEISVDAPRDEPGTDADR